MKRIYVKNGVTSINWRNLVWGGKPPKSMRTEGTIYVYKVDPKRLDPKTADD